MTQGYAIGRSHHIPLCWWLEEDRKKLEEMYKEISMDFNFVTSRIAVGAQIGSKDNLDQLVAAGITHIIDMQAEFDDHTLNDTRVIVLWLPQVDDGTPRPPGHYKQGVQFAFDNLANNHTAVFCHCAAGVNRGPTMCYALLRAFGFNKDTAIQMIKSVRPQVGFYNTQNYLDSVERDLNV